MIISQPSAMVTCSGKVKQSTSMLICGEGLRETLKSDGWHIQHLKLVTNVHFHQRQLKKLVAQG